MSKISRLILLSGLAVFAAVGVAHAETTPETCQRIYQACDRQCNAEDPDHGLSYAACSASCVASKATCEGGIIYDKSADWTSKQYKAAKPWVQEKAKQAEDIASDALKNSEAEYPKDGDK